MKLLQYYTILKKESLMNRNYDLESKEFLSIILINLDVDIDKCEIRVVESKKIYKIVERIREKRALEEEILLIPTQIHEIFDPDLQKFYMYFEIEEEGTFTPKEIIMTENAGKDVLVEISKISKKLTRCCDYNN